MQGLPGLVYLQACANNLLVEFVIITLQFLVLFAFLFELFDSADGGKQII